MSRLLVDFAIVDHNANLAVFPVDGKSRRTVLAAIRADDTDLFQTSQLFASDLQFADRDHVAFVDDRFSILESDAVHKRSDASEYRVRKFELRNESV